VFIRIASRKSAAAPAQLDSNSYDGGIIVSLMSLLITNSIDLSSDCNRYTNAEEDEQLALDGKVVVLGATLGISQKLTIHSRLKGACFAALLGSIICTNRLGAISQSMVAKCIHPSMGAQPIHDAADRVN
jgi:hypothetical protein